MAHIIIGEHHPARLKTLKEGMNADIILIKPGFGNKKDRHYYPKDVLRRDASKFQGVKMFATNHQEDEKTVNSWVASITESGKRFLSDGSPIARIAVHDKVFWDKMKILEEQKLLHTMHNSILAVGAAKAGEVDGRRANVVESIVAAKSVDFVPKAGAGGHVLQLMEQYAEEDLDAMTVAALSKQRPDLVEEIRKTEKDKLYGRITELQESLDFTQQALDQLEETRTMSDEERFAELDGKVGELTQRNAKLEAVQVLFEKSQSYDLPVATVNKIKSILMEGRFEEDADTESIVENLIEEEVTYLESIAKEVAEDADAEDTDEETVSEGDADGNETKGKTKARLAESETDDSDKSKKTTPGATNFSYQEGDDDNTPPTTLAERQSATDDVIARYVPGHTVMKEKNDG